jgi:type VI secretion system protein
MVTALKSATNNFQPAKVWLEKVQFKAADNVNDTSPVTVHIVIAYKPELLKELMKMDAETYFHKLDQLKSDYTGQIDVFEWDIIRGQRLEAPITPSQVSGEGVVVFARYSSPGDHRVAIADDHEVIIQLDKLDFKVIPVRPSSDS